MKLLWEIIQFVIYSGLIVLISKYILVRTLRSLAENLNLKPKTVGNIAGVATSVPELLTIGASSLKGLLGASIYNVLSSNVINLIQYAGAIALNKNQKALKNQAIKVDIILVVITILLPLIFSVVKSEFQLAMVPLLIILYLGCKKINNNAHALYLNGNEDKSEYEKEIENAKDEEAESLERIKYSNEKSMTTDTINQKANSNKRLKLVRDVIILLVTGILLFIIGNLLGDTLDTLCRRFNVPEIVIGIVLGFVTSIPELITFFEAQRHYKSLNNDMLGVIEATNNLLMSNMMNLFIIQSIGIVLFTGIS